MIERIFRNFALLGGFGLLLLLALTVAAVVMRKVFGTPLLGVFDISQMTLIVIVFSGLAYCGITRGHVAVDLFSDFFPPTIQKVLNVVINMVTAALLSMMAWFTAIHPALSVFPYRRARFCTVRHRQFHAGHRLLRQAAG